jgi:hydroxymethylbilane synthase
VSKKLTIGSRGSQLALTQTRYIRDALEAKNPGLKVEIEIIKTKGDVSVEPLRSFGGQGVFTKALEDALLAGHVDLAVHSLKDLPTAFHPDLSLTATPPRADVRDVLISQTDGGLDSLPVNAVLGTGSLRRQAQLKALRPDLRCVEIRGNIDTRIAKVSRREVDAVVLAAAAFERLGWQDRVSAYLDTDQILPAVGQAALALQMRGDSRFTPQVSNLNHPLTWAAVSAERAFLARLRAGCHAPVAAWARLQEDRIRLDGLVGRPDGTLLLKERIDGTLQDAVALGTQLAERLLDQGADDLIGNDTARS